MAIEYVPYNLTDEQVRELWDRYAQGETVAQVARFGKQHSSMYERIQAAGGIRPTIPTRAGRHLTLEDREEISRGLAAGHSLRQIAGRLGRAPSTVTREVGANGGGCGSRVPTVRLEHRRSGVRGDHFIWAAMDARVCGQSALASVSPRRTMTRSRSGAT
jgi:hypothetical protein